MTKKPFVLVDGSSYLFRAYHGLPAFTNSKGDPSGALYGVINMLKRLLKDYKPQHVAIVFDTKSKNFRHQLFPDYKANRPEMPADLACQIKPLHDIIRAMGFPLIAIDGVEADDVIGTLAREAERYGLDTIISTGDKDMAQLVTDKITLVNTMSETTMDIKGVKEKFGVGPELIVDYLTLVGDAVDNIPGVPKVGPKTAVKFLQTYGSLQGVMDHADEVKGKVGENLRNSLDQLPLSKTLVTIKEDVEIGIHPKALLLKAVDKATLLKFFKHYEFRRWQTELEEDNGTQVPSEKKYELILDEKTLHQWCEKLKEADVFAFDTETTSLNYMQAKVVGVSFSVKPYEAAYVPFGHVYENVPMQLSKQTVLDALRPLLENKTPKIIGQHIKYDCEVLANEGVQLNAIAFDTMLESYVLDSQATRHDMDSLALKYCDRQTISYEEVAGKGAKQISFSEVPIEVAGNYAAEDADITMHLHQVLWGLLSKDKKLEKVFQKIEMPLIPVLTKMERQGVLIDVDLLAKQSVALQARLDELEKASYVIAKEEFNLNSPKQLQEILYEKLKLPVLKKTPKGQASTAEPVLQELAHDYPLPKMILEYRSLSKLKSTYTDTLPEQCDPNTRRIHTSYHQAVTATGRLSSSNPNLQNIPVRTEEGRRIRQAFIAPKGYQLLAADYSQIELRIMAHLSNDKGLLEAFAKGLDVHSATASEVFDTPLEKVTKDQRRHAKAINFGLIYGMSAFGLSRQLGIERDAAQTYIDLYFSRYPGVKTYMDDTCMKAHQLGYVETLFGRRLYLPDINAKNFQRQRGAERAAINAPLQGTAADIIKLAMIKMHDWLQTADIDANMLMQVHDELVFEVKEEAVAVLEKQTKEIMSSAAQLSVDLIVEVGVGANWDEAH